MHAVLPLSHNAQGLTDLLLTLSLSLSLFFSSSFLLISRSSTRCLRRHLRPLQPVSPSRKLGFSGTTSPVSFFFAATVQVIWGGGGGELVPATSALCSPGGREEEEDQVALRFLSSAFWSLQGIPPGLDC